MEREKFYTDDEILRELETERMFLRKFGHNGTNNKLIHSCYNKNNESSIEYIQAINSNTHMELMKKGQNNYSFENYL